MSCNLKKMTTYDIGRVVHDNSAGTYTAQLVRPPASCPDSVFVSKKAQIKVVEGSGASLFFDMAQAKPVIVVPSKGYIEEVGSSGIGFGFGVFFAVAIFGLLAVYLITRRSSTPALAGGSGRSYGGSSPSGSGPYNSGGPSGGGGTTIVNNNSSNDGLLTGVVLGSMMSNNRSERIIEKETTIIERDSSPSRDSDSYSSDSGSDDSSSFSSDSSSDSSSSFSSDSGGSSFSSDSGGGSFSSDS